MAGFIYKQIVFTLVLILGVAFVPSFLAQAKTPACKTPPWEIFSGTAGQRPYRPLITLEPTKRIGRSPPFPGARLNVDLTLNQNDNPIMIGDTPVVGAPVTQMLPGEGTSGYYFEPDGALCVVTREQMETPRFREAFGYSGVRLQLSHGDLLAMNMRSRLPFKKSDPSTSSRPAQAPFGGAPCQMSNVHTHGLLVSPYKRGNVLGDYVLDLAKPSVEVDDACLTAASVTHTHGDMVDVLKHRIRIPRRPIERGQADALQSGKHPSGLFWFHPHPHGYSASQLTGGTSGLITVGELSDYADKIPDHTKFNMRFLMLKDSQVEPIADSSNFRFRANAEPTLCDASPGDNYFWSDGVCKGAGDARWLFTVNGVQNPHIANDVQAGESELWRIANASPTVTYRLSIIPANEARTTPLNSDGSPKLTRKPFKVIAKDGAALTSDASMGAEEKEILLMPGARVEILLRDLGKDEWALVSEGVLTGGDSWPRVVLASLKGADPTPAVVSTAPYAITSDGPTLPPMPAPVTVAKKASGGSPLPVRRACDRLDGRQRVILLVKNPKFGDGDNWKGKDLFGVIAGVRNAGDTDLAHAIYFQRDAASTDLEKMPQASLDKIQQLLIKPYDAASTTNFIPAFGNYPEFGNVCVPLARDGAEEWVIENWTNEIHNFHIHQTRFFVTDRNVQDKAYFDFPCKRSDYPDTPDNAACRPDGSTANVALTGFGDQLIEQFYRGHTSMGRDAATLKKSAHDSVPIPRGTKDCDGDPTNKACAPGRVTLRIPFNRKEQVGTFVYHCHILEHEDRGMMGIVEVRER